MLAQVVIMTLLLFNVALTAFKWLNIFLSNIFFLLFFAFAINIFFLSITSFHSGDSNANVDQYDGKWWLRFPNWEAEHFLIRRLLVESLFMITPVLNFWIFTKFTLKANLLILSFHWNAWTLYLTIWKLNKLYYIIPFTCLLCIISVKQTYAMPVDKFSPYARIKNCVTSCD